MRSLNGNPSCGGFENVLPMAIVTADVGRRSTHVESYYRRPVGDVAMQCPSVAYDATGRARQNRS